MESPYDYKISFMTPVILVMLVLNIAIVILGIAFDFYGYPGFVIFSGSAAVALFFASSVNLFLIRKKKNYNRNMSKIMKKEKRRDLFGADTMIAGIREDLSGLRASIREEADGMRADMREELEEWGVGDPFLRQYRERAKKRIEMGKKDKKKSKKERLENLGIITSEMVEDTVSKAFSHLGNLKIGTSGKVNISGNGKIVVGGVDITKQVKRMGGDGSNISIIDDPARGGYIIKSGKKQIYLDKEGLELDRQYDQAMEDLGYRPKPEFPENVTEKFDLDTVKDIFKDTFTGMFKRRKKKATSKGDLNLGVSDSKSDKIDLTSNPLED